MGTPRFFRLVCVLSLTLATPALAQSAFGFSLGATNADLRGVDVSSRWGGTIGIFGSFLVNPNLLVALEGNWTQKGAQDVKIEYVEIPLLLGGVLPVGGGVWVRAYGGVEVGFKTSCSTDSGTQLTCDGVNSTVWSIPFGLLVGKTSTSGIYTGLDIRYSVTLTDTFTNVSSVYNRTWYFRFLVGKG